MGDALGENTQTTGKATMETGTKLENFDIENLV